MTAFSHKLWGEIVPDGPGHCHWGGQKQSVFLTELLDIKTEDRVLEICCGQGGLLSCLPRKGLVIGFDLSLEAVTVAQKYGFAVQADAFCMPFHDCSFTKLISQDADAWIYKERSGFTRELYRVAGRGARLIVQSYACAELIAPSEKAVADGLLKACGYSETNLPTIMEMISELRGVGFRIAEIRTLHKTYRKDSRRMLEKLRRKKVELIYLFDPEDLRAVEELLLYENQLFQQKRWTGVLIVAERR